MKKSASGKKQAECYKARELTRGNHPPFLSINSTSKSKRYLRWLVEGSSTYYVYAFVAFFLAALISSLI